jgi:hypothetical protein
LDLSFDGNFNGRFKKSFLRLFSLSSQPKSTTQPYCHPK